MWQTRWNFLNSFRCHCMSQLHILWVKKRTDLPEWRQLRRLRDDFIWSSSKCIKMCGCAQSVCHLYFISIFSFILLVFYVCYAVWVSPLISNKCKIIISAHWIVKNDLWLDCFCDFGATHKINDIWFYFLLTLWSQYYLADITWLQLTCFYFLSCTRVSF